MSTKYSGGLITKNPVLPAGPYETGAAPGVWTVEQALQYTKQGIWPTAGNVPAYIEDVFSTYLYQGTGATQTITNGINLAAYGGMVWMKNRVTAYNNAVVDSARGLTSGRILYTNSAAAQQTGFPENTAGISAFNSNGFTLRADSNGVGTNYGVGENEVSWTFREQPKFFDIVTYSGNSTAGRQVAHNLGAVPGCMIVRNLLGGPWYVYHQALGNTQTLVLNSSTNAGTDPSWNNTTPTASVFTLGDNYQVNYTGNDYVAYLFAHNAGGFGLTGTDNAITCGSFVTDGSGKITAPVNLGYEVQWLLVKNSGSSENWQIYDTMRRMSNTGYSVLYPNLNSTESSGASAIAPNATGFSTPNASGPFASFANYIYIAIRRGPMKVPTDATKVFIPYQGNGNGGVGETFTTNFPVDLSVNAAVPPNTNYGPAWTDRLRGSGSTNSPELISSGTAAQNNQAPTYYIGMDSNTTLFNKSYGSLGKFVNWAFRRAPSFFDEVCYLGTGSATTFNHNLGVVPEMMIVKGRSVNANWAIYTAATGATKSLFFTDSPAGTYSVVWNDTAPTASVFTVGTAGTTNSAGGTYVAYLFATCPGVSKVGAYTGTGAVQTINCGFTGGARFVLIKRTDSTGNWWVYDTARGMVTGNDNYLTLNTTDAQGTVNSVTTASTGFQLTAENYVDINTNGGSYIFLAIA